MNRVEAALRGIASDLDVLHIRWALVGGFAVSVRTEPRFTRDVDVAVLVDDDPAAEQLVRSLIAGHLVALKLLARDDDTRPQDAADRARPGPVGRTAAGEGSLNVANQRT